MPQIDLRIAVEHHEGKYPSFNVFLSNGDKDAFLTIRGCRIVSGKEGEFVSWPATKNDNTGKWWNHVFSSKEFNETVLQIARDTQPLTNPPRRSSKPADDDDVPF